MLLVDLLPGLCIYNKPYKTLQHTAMRLQPHNTLPLQQTEFFACCGKLSKIVDKKKKSHFKPSRPLEQILALSDKLHSVLLSCLYFMVMTGREGPELWYPCMLISLAFTGDDPRQPECYRGGWGGRSVPTGVSTHTTHTHTLFIF